MVDINNSLVSFTAEKPLENDDFVILKARVNPVNPRDIRTPTEKVICLNPAKENINAITYEPQETAPELYRIAAHLPLDEQSILNFYLKWGFLDLGISGWLVDHPEMPEYYVDPLCNIKTQLKSLKHLCDVLDNIKKADKLYGKENYPQEIEGFASVSWLELNNGTQDIRLSFHRSGLTPSVAQNNDRGDTIPDIIKWGDFRSALVFYLGKKVNQHLSPTTRTALLYINDKYKPKHLWDQGCFIQPKSLLGVLWYQLADEIQGGRTAYYCETCNAPFTKLAKPRGKLPKYCTDACRQKAFRKSRKKTTN